MNGSQRQPHNRAYLIQIRKPWAPPARPVTLSSSFEQYVGFPKSRSIRLHTAAAREETENRAHIPIIPE